MYKFNLIENAQDSLKHALEHIGPVQKNDAGDWKRIIVDCAHVIELLFKERLRQVHPAFVFENIDKYPSPDAFTVSAKTALDRLRKIGNVDFSEEDIRAICAAREKRNQIEHYEFFIADHEAKALVGQAVSFIFRFSADHLDLDWKKDLLQSQSWWVLSQYTELYQGLLQKATEKIEAEELAVIECTSCRNETFDIDAGACLVCGHEEEVLDCRRCKSPYIYSSCEYDEAAELCPTCERKDGYASANFEKY